MLGNAPAVGGGIERNSQFLGPLFEKGNYFELSYGHVSPSASGSDRGAFGSKTGNILGSYNSTGLAYKHQFNEDWSAALMIDQPLGADLLYPEGGSFMLGGTGVDVSSLSVTGVVRYKLPQSPFGVHAGIRALRTDGSVAVGGAAFGPVSGYNMSVDEDTAYGWLAGVSWERPEIGARVSMTYTSPIDNHFQATEQGPLVDPDGPGPAPGLPLLDGSSPLKVSTPESWNIAFQTGITPKTLLFGSIRWVEWSTFRIDPERLWQVTGNGLVYLNDSTTYMLGVGHAFSDSWSGAVSFSFEKAGSDEVSPLAPTNGSKSITLAAIYTRDRIKVTTGVTYAALGDAKPTLGTPPVSIADVEGSHAWGAGVKIGYSF
ncbi:outer membrane protein transport protein [Cereibacter sp. SYSU M97828]|nr:outer membrane protein transport protein [Cereibacter flavus]